MSSTDGVFHFKALPSAIRAAQVVGITSAAALSGYIASFSVLAIPTIASSPPSLKAKQWEKAYGIGAGTSLYIAIPPTISFVFLAYQATQLPKAWHGTLLDPRPAAYLYSIAAILVPAIVPWTLTAMRSTNDKLHAKADDLLEDVKDDDELNALLPRWQTLNSIRAAMPGLAALAGMWAVVSRPEFIGLSVLE